MRADYGVMNTLVRAGGFEPHHRTDSLKLYAQTVNDWHSTGGHSATAWFPCLPLIPLQPSPKYS